MKLKKIMATATVASALGLGGVGVANAAPGGPLPEKPGHCDGNFNCQPGPGPGGSGPNPAPFNRNDHNWYNGNDDHTVGSPDWWRGRPGKWWRDGDLPPWGFWGPPPPVQWSGPPPWVNPHPVNYWGYQATPVWDNNFHGWGIWLFGIFIPIVGISAY